jgi:anti-anti-sigma factor
MVPVGPALSTVADLPPAPGHPGPDVVVWLRGGHDISTEGALRLTLARAIALDGAGLVLDLSEVTFMGASTLEVIARTGEFLRQHSASLTVRSPSTFVRRIISVCGLDDLLGPSPEEAGGAPGKALGPRVAGPATAPGDVQAAPSTPSPRRVDLQAGRAAASKERAVATDQLAEIA